ncbi:hypothetical protein JXB11_00840 [Candidatus Woesearchaeota archaeon]|nr:hypothetical protein [Candidatus Woesearchaeota archaeon]
MKIEGKHNVTPEEIEQLESLIGKEISTSGSCVAQDENGISSNCDMAQHTGILRRIEYNSSNTELGSITIESDLGLQKVTFPKEDHDRVWDMHRGIYHEGKEVLAVSSKPKIYE